MKRIASTIVRLAWLASACGGCSTTQRGDYLRPDYLSGRNYAYAVFDSGDRMLHSPIDALQREIEERRIVTPDRPISDVYVFVHGWDYTVEESFNLYEGYRHALEKMLTEIRKPGVDPSFEPFFVFTVWSSVSRPVSDVVRSVLPWTPPDWLQMSAGAVDAAAFHIPSSWGESQDAMRIAMGAPTRWTSSSPRWRPSRSTTGRMTSGWRRRGSAASAASRRRSRC